MRIRKTLVAALAVAIAIAFSPLPELQAASLLSPGSQPAAQDLTQVVKAKKKKAGKKKAGKKKRGKRAKSKGPGRCGTYMYFSKKARKCLDARNKK
jgi:hypothetical protein